MKTQTIPERVEAVRTAFAKLTREVTPFLAEQGRASCIESQRVSLDALRHEAHEANWSDFDNWTDRD